MSNKVFEVYTWIKSALITVCLLFVFALSSFAVYARPYDIINAATSQTQRCQTIAKDALLLEYTPITQPGTRARAISELQDIVPVFQQEEAFLQTIQRDNIKLAMVGVTADYLPLVTALKTIMNQADRSIDPLQATVIAQHERPYTLGVNQVIELMLQDLDGIDQELFVFNVMVFALLMLLALVDPVLMIRHMRAVKRKETSAP